MVRKWPRAGRLSGPRRNRCRDPRPNGAARCGGERDRRSVWLAIIFGKSLVDYATHGSWPDPPGVQLHQEAMRLRATDRAVYPETKLTPLSVSTDKIGVVAMRRARLLAAHWEATGGSPDRSGASGIVEVFPAAALVQWGISQRSGVPDPGTYKGPSPEASARRVRIVDAIAGRAPWLEINEKVRVVCADSDDCLDALICALVARAYELGRILPVADLVAAQAKGWIHLPASESLDLLGRAERTGGACQ